MNTGNLELSNTYEIYGKLMIEREILEGKIQYYKGLIAQELNKQPLKEEDIKKSE